MCEHSNVYAPSTNKCVHFTFASQHRRHTVKSVQQTLLNLSLVWCQLRELFKHSIVKIILC